ncbi:DEAD/DEAH box helicase [Hydrogenophaga defluvii]
MHQAEWVIDEGRLKIKDRSGGQFFPSAMQVYSAVFSSLTEIEGRTLDCLLPDACPNLSFSRFPAEPAVWIKNTNPSSIVVTTGVSTDLGYCDVPDGADQVISGGKWYPVNLEALQAAKVWIAGLGVTEGNPISFGQLIALRSAHDVPAKLIDDSLLVASDIATSAGKAFCDVPGLNAELYPYQKDGVAFLRLIAQQEIGCVLADEMGLGKTLQVIGLLQSEHNRCSVPSLVIAPATIVENWRRELAQFSPLLKVHVHAGAGRAGIAERLSPFDVVITSFDTAIRDEPLLSSIEWNLLVLDEAQAIKNPDAQRTQAVKRIPRRVSLAVTGTPVENRLDDLWSLADFALPGLLGSVSEFRASFSDDINDASRLGPIVSPILLRRKVADVAKDLPPKIEIPQPIKMTEGLAEAYEALRRQTLEEYGPAAAMVATSRLRMFCTHPYLIDNGSGDPSVDMPKYARLLELLAEIFESNEKALVFTTYQGMADLLMRDIPQRWPKGFFRFIDGRVPVATRQPTVDQFYDFKGFGALFLNPKAAGAGLNITAANHVIHFNPEWNPALTDQASGRAYRRKQLLPVTIHYLYFVDSVEEVMLDRAQFKRGLAGEAVIGHEGEIDPSIIVRALQISPLSKFQEHGK